MFSRQSTEEGVKDFTEKQVGQFFLIKHKTGYVKLELKELTATRGWFASGQNRLSIFCNSVTPLLSPDGPPLTILSSKQIGQTFWVQRGDTKVKLVLVGLEARRGWFALKKSLLSIHRSKVTPIIEDAEEQEMLDEINDDALSSDDELAAFTQAQEEKQALIAKALNLAVAKLKQTIIGLKEKSSSIEAAFLTHLPGLLTYLEQKVQALQNEEGPFRALPDQDGPGNEVASAQGHLICLYKPFFASGVTSSQQADYLIHESVHSHLKVIDYAYIWQHIFRFLPIAIRLKNPDSYVALVRSFNGEASGTPNSGDDLNDYTLGMIQHICMRGKKLMEECRTQWDSLNSDIVPEPLRSLKALYDKYTEDQLKALVTLCTSPATTQIASAVNMGNLLLVFSKPLPAKVDDAQGKIENGKIIVSYIETTASAPYIAILVKILLLYSFDKQKAIAIAKALDALTARCMDMTVPGPSKTGL